MNPRTLTWIPAVLLVSGASAFGAPELRFEPQPYTPVEASTSSPHYEFSAKAEKAYADKHRFAKPRSPISKDWKELKIEHLTREAFLDWYQNDDLLRSPNGAWIDKIRGGTAFGDLGSSQKQLFASLRLYDRLVADTAPLSEIYPRWIEDYERRHKAHAERQAKGNTDWFDGLMDAPDSPRKAAYLKESGWQKEEQAVLSRLKKVLNEIYNQEKRLQSKARSEAKKLEREKKAAERKAAMEKRKRDRLEANKRKEEEKERKKRERELARTRKVPARPAPASSAPIGRPAPTRRIPARPAPSRSAPSESGFGAPSRGDELAELDLGGADMDLEGLEPPSAPWWLGFLPAGIFFLSGLASIGFAGALTKLGGLLASFA